MSDRDYSKIGQSPVQSNVDTSLELDELNMRATLGRLGGGSRAGSRPQPGAAPKQRHRFVQDGEVPVIHLSGPRDGDAMASLRGRIAAIESERDAEHAARLKAEQSAQAALSQVHALETKLGHVEMSAREAVAIEREARGQVEAELQRAIATRDAAQQALSESAIPAPGKERVKSPPRVPKQHGLPRVKEPQPVKWWLGKPEAKATSR